MVPIEKLIEDMANEKISNSMIAFVKQTREASARTIQELIKGLEKNPAYAFEWSQDSFTAAGRDFVFAQIEDALISGCKVQDVLSTCLDRALQGARSPTHSTSEQSNIINQEKTAAWAYAYEQLKRFV